MKTKLIIGTIATLSIMSCLTGCGLKSEMKTAMANNQSIKLSVEGEVPDDNEPITWVELDQLNTFPEIRNTWEDKLQVIIFDNGSKNGMVYVDTQGNWAGNNVIFNVFQNKVFVKENWAEARLKSELADKAIEQFSDISNEQTGIYASVNAFFNLLPINKDGSSGLLDNLSRAQVMSAIYRGDTPVTFLEENESFTKAVEGGEYSIYAQEVADISYLDYKNGGLNYDTFNGPCTRGEAIYMLVQRYFKSDYDSLELKGNKLAFTDCSNAGDIGKKLKFPEDGFAREAFELEWCLQNKKDGCPEDIYKALVVAHNKGIIQYETMWSEPISGGSFLKLLIGTYRAYQSQDGENQFLVNAKTGNNAGNSLYVAEVEIDTDKGTVAGIDQVGITQVRDVTNLDDLFKIYGDEINMTPDEIAEAYENAGKFHFEPVDKWMQVDFCYFLNVRTGPSTDFRILRSVPTGTKVHIVARCVENGWYRIIAEQKIVYQCGIYFSDFEGSEEYMMRTGDLANDNSNLTGKNSNISTEELEKVKTDPSSLISGDNSEVSGSTEEVDDLDTEEVQEEQSSSEKESTSEVDEQKEQDRKDYNRLINSVRKITKNTMDTTDLDRVGCYKLKQDTTITNTTSQEYRILTLVDDDIVVTILPAKSKIEMSEGTIFVIERVEVIDD